MGVLRVHEGVLESRGLSEPTLTWISGQRAVVEALVAVLGPVVEVVEPPAPPSWADVLSGVFTRHALVWCPSCGEWAWFPSATTKDGRWSSAVCHVCHGRVEVPPIAQRPRPKRVAVDPVPLVRPGRTQPTMREPEAEGDRACTHAHVNEGRCSWCAAVEVRSMLVITPESYVADAYHRAVADSVLAQCEMAPEKVAEIRVRDVRRYTVARLVHVGGGFMEQRVEVAW